MAIRISGLNSGLDTDSIVQELVSAYSKKTEKYEKAQTKLGWKQEIWKDLNKKVNTFYKSLDSVRFSGGYNTKKTTSSDTVKATVSAKSGAVSGTQKLHILSTAQAGYLTGGKISLKKAVTRDDGTSGYETVDGKVTSDTKLSELGFDGDSASIRLSTKDKNGQNVEKDISITKDSTINDVVSQLKDAGLNASFDAGNGRIFLSAKDTGANSDFTLAQTGASDENAKKVLGFLGLDTSTSAYGDKATKIEGSDASIVLNGVLYTNSSNNFSINGLSIAVNGVTDDANDYMTDGVLDQSKIANMSDDTAITITTSTDVQGIYDKIKDFLTNYNNIINEMTKLYNAKSAGSYEPLTDEEKDEMSDTEIEKWETKIKDSLLRRDNSLSTVMSAMTSAMSQSITIDGKSYALSSFGIKTLGTLNAAENEQNAYHIDGDEDDENTSGNTDKLMAAITEDPDTVVNFMTQLTSNLYKAIDDQMKSTSLRSKYCIYNDKELDTQYTNYTKTIKEWEQKVSDKEDYYYKKFSAMETALGNLQSQTSSLTGLFGN